MASLQRAAGGVTGIGAPVAARQFLDEPGQKRYTQPSVLAGVGTGVVSGALYLTDVVDVPLLDDEFLASHAITSTPLGLFYAAFPRKRGTTTTQQVQEALLGGSGTRRGTGGSNGGGGSSGSTEVMVQGHGDRRRGAGSGV